MTKGINWRLVFRRVVLCTALAGITALVSTFRPIEKIKPLFIEIHIIRQESKETAQAQTTSQASSYLVPQGAQLRDLWPILKMKEDDYCWTNESCAMTLIHGMTFVVSAKGEVKKADKIEKSKKRK